MDKSKLALLLAGVALLVGGLGLVLPGQPSVQVVKEIIERLGATPGSDFPGPCISVDGVRTCSKRIAMNRATSTVCGFISPSASSTLKQFTAKIDTSTSSVVLVLQSHLTSFYAPALSVATSVNTLASMELVGNIATGTVISFSPTSTAVAINPLDVLPPQTGVVLFAKNGLGALVTQAGTGDIFRGICTATFQEL